MKRLHQKSTLLFSLLFTILFGSAQAQDTLTLNSPNGFLTFVFKLGTENKPTYEIRYKGQTIISPSPLGLLKNTQGYDAHLDWHKNFTLIGSSRRTVNTTWKAVYGEREVIPDHFQELTITLLDSAKLKKQDKGPIQLIVRAYDEGVAFRYFFPGTNQAQSIEIGQEESGFNLPSDAMIYTAYEPQSTYHPHSVKALQGQFIVPLTVKHGNGLWSCILQAEHTQFPQMRVQIQNGKLLSRIQGNMVAQTPFHTPWRVVMVAEKPTRLLENNYLVMNLNPPNEVEDLSWIKPGRVMREMTLSTPCAKELIDFAVEQNIDYIHFDAGWYGHEYDHTADATTVTVDPRRNPANDLDLKSVIDYAKARNKGVILYVNQLALSRQLDALLPLYKQWGVAGLKFGFVQVGSHHSTVWLHNAIRKAAQHKLMVNVHDEYLPSGFNRTYPNLMTQEGVLGNEAFPDATHNTTLPFTRLLAGPADYTYCFNEPTGRLLNTKVHQLTLPLIIYSPWQYLYWYGKPEHYANREEIKFWKELPTTWHETRVLDGIPGVFTAIARRHQDEWFVGAITNNTGRNIPIDFSFLPKRKKFIAEIFEDDGNGGVRTRTQLVTQNNTVDFCLIDKGGLSIHLKRKRPKHPMLATAGKRSRPNRT